MKIAVSAVDATLDASVDPRLGRCPYFLVVDTETMSYDAIPNASRSALSDAGIQAVQTIARHGVKLAITGSVGPNAFQALSAARIDVITSVKGTVREAIDQYKTGGLRHVTTGPTASPRYGRGGGTDAGWGRGMGRGQGGGFGRWQATGPPSPPRPRRGMPSPTHEISKERELQRLQAQATTMQGQLAQVQRRLTPLQNDKSHEGGD
jgi:predicted Fe-Mo cluster-binding NifX family protein